MICDEVSLFSCEQFLEMDSAKSLQPPTPVTAEEVCISVQIWVSCVAPYSVCYISSYRICIFDKYMIAKVCVCVCEGVGEGGKDDSGEMV